MTVKENAHSSYRGFLGPDEQLPRSVCDVLDQFEREGWRPVDRIEPQGFRYWCPCDRQHQVWISSQKIRQERLRFILARTCLTFK